MLTELLHLIKGAVLEFLRAKEAGSRFDLMSIVFIVASCFAWSLLPAIDFDEALYVEMARVMLDSKQYLQPIWDNLPLFDKPPTFMWSLLPFIVETPGEYFPGLPRLVPILSSLGVAFVSALFVKRKMNIGLRRREFLVVAFSAFMPTIGAGLLLIDLLMSLALLPAFLLLYSYFNGIRGLSDKDWRSFTWQETIAIAGSVSAAAWLKGLIAWVVPGLSVTAFVCLMLPTYLRNQSTLQQNQFVLRRSVGAVSMLIPVFKIVISRFWKIFFLSLLGTLFFYVALALKGHVEFVKEFFLQHHVGRGTAAMEGHSGPFFYHWLIVFFGGGWLIAGAFRLGVLKFGGPLNSSNVGPAEESKACCDYERPGVLFPLIWFFTPIVFFSFIATKLPNYTWPSWMALPALFAALYSSPQKFVGVIKQKQLQFASAAVCAILASAYFAVAIALVAFPFLVFDLPFKIDYRVQEIIDSAPRMNSLELVSCILLGLIAGAIGYQIYATRHINSTEGLLKKARVVSLLHGFFLVAFACGLASYPNAVYRIPITEAAQYLTTHYTNLDVLTFGIKSPTFSGLYRGNGTIRQVGKDSNAYAEWVAQKHLQLSNRLPSQDSSQLALVVPIWNKKNCEAMFAHEVAQFRFLKVCIKARSFHESPSRAKQ